MSALETADDSIRQHLDKADSTMTKSTIQTDFQLEPTVDLTESSQNVPSTGPLGSFQELESIFSNDSIAADLLVDSDSSENDKASALGETNNYFSTKSLRSSIYQFVEENGRTYHHYREGKYYLPNDEQEQERLDLQHHLFLLTLSGELHIAPIDDIQRAVHTVLDIGTGTGLWAQEFAEMFPSSRVIGTDLSPIQPLYVPTNCCFQVDDVEEEWSFSHKFDYIHGRMLLTCFKSHFPVIKSAFEFLNPGGYLELQDCLYAFHCLDNSIKGTTLENWFNLVLKGTIALGKDWTRATEYKKYLEQVGFEDVVEKKFAWPVGTWARGKRMKTLGLWCRENLLAGLEGISLAILTRGLAMTKEQVDVLLAGARDDIKSNRIHFCIPVRVVYGRKPSL